MITTRFYALSMLGVVAVIVTMMAFIAVVPLQQQYLKYYDLAIKLDSIVDNYETKVPEYLEIYLKDDIMFVDINNQQITFERNSDILNFKTNESLVEYIGWRSANSANTNEAYTIIKNNKCNPCKGNLIWIDYKNLTIYIEDIDIETKYESLEHLNYQLEFMKL